VAVPADVNTRFSWSVCDARTKSRCQTSTPSRLQTADTRKASHSLSGLIDAVYRYYCCRRGLAIAVDYAQARRTTLEASQEPMLTERVVGKQMQSMILT
jgi:hypothetical protein